MFFHGYCLIWCHTNQNSFFTDMYCQAWVKWHWHYNSTDCQSHQPPGEASAGPGAAAQGEQQVSGTVPGRPPAMTCCNCHRNYWISSHNLPESRPSLQFWMLRTRVNIFFQTNNIWAWKMTESVMFYGLNGANFFRGTKCRPSDSRCRLCLLN